MLRDLQRPRRQSWEEASEQCGTVQSPRRAWARCKRCGREWVERRERALKHTNKSVECGRTVILQVVHTDCDNEEEGQQEGDQQGDPDGEWFACLCSVDGQREEQDVDDHAEPKAGVAEDAGRHDLDCKMVVVG